MNVLLIGGGGREHALAWKLAQSPALDRLYAAPGNPGIAEHAELVALDPADHAAVIAWARDHAIGLVVIGPEAPLVAGLADSLRAVDIPVFGPSAAAARLEGSKGFTKDLCARAGIPTAGYVRVTDRAAAAVALDRTFGLPVVVKADGLAAGKGVTVATTRADADAALDGIFADAGGEAVIEEFLSGEEVSLFVLTDGTAILPFGTAQDHKRVGEGDTGPNTGGMGAYSPAPVLTSALETRAMAEIIAPTVRAMADAGTPFSGVLYAGLMLTADGPKLIEYNARFGDPECQVLMARFDGDLVLTLLAVAQSRLAELPPAAFSPATALTVVIAAQGYPGRPRLGDTITGVDAAEAAGALVFQAGTREEGGQLVTAGGRVLAVTASGADIGAAQTTAYRGLKALHVANAFHRQDIGWREVARRAAAATEVTAIPPRAIGDDPLGKRPVNQQTSAPGSSLLHDSVGMLTSAHFIMIAIFAALVVIGIIWGARMKARRKAAERDVIEHNEQMVEAMPVGPRETQARPVPPPVPIMAVTMAANDSAADGSLTQLKGLGPKVADRLAELGVTSVGQIAALSDDNAVRLDDQLGPFRGRMMRDRWIEQARFLAAGDRAGFESVFGRL